MTLKKLEIEALRADLAQLSVFLNSNMEVEDPIGYRQFVLRKEQVSAQLAELDQDENTNAAVGVFFSGTPVYGSKGVLADFASKAVAAFQDVVSKRLAATEAGALGQRGPVPFRPSSDLMITDMARGSIGLILEEATQQSSLTDSSLKVTIDQVVDLLADVGALEEQVFERATETLDSRQLGAVQTLFAVLDENGATVRFVESDKERSLDAPAVSRGKTRTEAMEIEETESTTLSGKLIGLIPGHRRFELETAPGQVIYGAVSADFSKSYVGMLGKVEGRFWRTKMRVREIRRRNRPPKFTYTLLGLLEEIKSPR